MKNLKNVLIALHLTPPLSGVYFSSPFSFRFFVFSLIFTGETTVNARKVVRDGIGGHAEALLRALTTLDGRGMNHTKLVRSTFFYT